MSNKLIKKSAIRIIFLGVIIGIFVFSDPYNNPFNYSKDKVHEIVELPEMEAKVLITYPMAVHRNWYDSKYYFKVTFKILYGKNGVYAFGWGDIYENSNQWSSLTMSPIKICPNFLSRTKRSKSWVVFEKPINGYLELKYYFQDYNKIIDKDNNIPYLKIKYQDTDLKSDDFRIRIFIC